MYFDFGVVINHYKSIKADQNRYFMKKLSLLTMFLLMSFIIFLFGIQSAFASNESINSSNFNGTAISSGKYIWFSSNFTLDKVSSFPLIIYLDSASITFNDDSKTYNQSVPKAVITIDTSITTDSINFDKSTNSWIINVSPDSKGMDEIFLSGLSFQVPSGGLPGGINPVVWTAYFRTNQPGTSLKWKWSAAVYSNFSADYNQLGVLPLHSIDHTGTPVNFAQKDNCITGAKGGGGSNFTGSWSGTVTVNSLLPVELFTFTLNAAGRNIQLNWETKTEHNSYKFDVERGISPGNWESIGSVQAAVLSNSPKDYYFTDKNLQAGNYQYRLKMIDNDGTFKYSDIVETEVTTPKEFELSQNYPNPFNPTTKIDYLVPVDAKVILEVYNIAGQKVSELVNQEQSAGYYSVDFGGSNLSSGVYIYRIVASDKATGNNFSSIKKMMLLK
jgi:Secretion system C-terminal sorting domain